MARGFSEMMRMIREEEPPRPSTRLSVLGETATRTAQQRHTDIKKLGLLLRDDLDWIVMKCLEKDRTRRYDTANGLAMDIHRHLNDEPVVAGPPSARYRLGKFIRRNRSSVIAATAVAVALLLGAAGTTAGMFRAFAAERETRHELTRATEVKRLITEILGSIDPMVAQGRDRTLLNEILDDSAERLSSGEIKDELIAAELHHVIGVAYRTIGAWGKAKRHLSIALEIRTRLLGEENPATLLSMREQLVLTMLAGGPTPEERIAMARKILKLRERVLGPDDPDTLTSMEMLGSITGTFGGLAEADRIIAKNLEARRRVLGPEHRDTLESMAHLALLRLRQGRLTEAEPLLVESLETRTRVLGENDPDTLVAIGNLCALYEAQDRYEDSLPLRRRSVAIAESVLGGRHPYTPGLFLGLGSVCFILGHHEEAASVYEDDVRKRLRLLDMNSAGDDVPSAGELFEVYWRVHREALWAMTAGTTRTAMRNLATSYDMIGRRADALALYLELLRHLPEDPDDERAGPFALSTVAWVLTRDHPEVNDPERALEFARSAVAKATDGSRNLHIYLDALALALYQTGARAEAIETERRAIESIPDIEPRPGNAETDEIVRARYEERLRAYEASMAGQTPHPAERSSPQSRTSLRTSIDSRFAWGTLARCDALRSERERRRAGPPSETESFERIHRWTTHAKQ
jgi:tetratricopeptide (TPR) repeat protein